MFFRNLIVHRWPADGSWDVERLEKQLAKLPFQPCTGLALESRGWIPPRGDDRLVVSVGRQWLIALGVEAKLLPASVVKQEVEQRAKDIEARMGVKPGRKRLRDLKDEVTDELLPRAFSRYNTTFAWIDPVNGWFCVDAGSPKKTEDFLEVLRRTLDDPPFSLVHTQRSPTAAMADWLSAKEAPHGFSIDRECVLQSTLEEKATVRYAHHPLTDNDEIRNHIEAGKAPVRLALTWQDRVSFVLGETMELRRVQLTDVTATENEGGAESAEEQFETDFTLMTGLYAQFLTDLLEALGGEKTDA